MKTNKIEQLEQRNLFSLITVAEGFPGFYEVTGEDVADTVTITVDEDARTFTVNGTTYGHGAANGITVNCLDGDDTLTASANRPNGPIGLNVVGGGGKDRLVSSNLSGGMWGDDGNDYLEQSNSYRAEMYGGTGDDTIVVKGDCVDNRLHGNEGNDIIDGRSLNCPAFIYGEDGNDTMYGSPFGDIIDAGAGSNTIFAGAGDDMLYCKNGALDRIDGGTGHNTAKVDLTSGGAPAEMQFRNVEYWS
jgi:Ca2+-binding RTX toxin-like protein